MFWHNFLHKFSLLRSFESGFKQLMNEISANIFYHHRIDISKIFVILSDCSKMNAILLLNAIKELIVVVLE